MVEKVSRYVGRNKYKAKAKQQAEDEEEKREQGSANFHDVLNTVIETIALDHPHHSLWQIFALSNGDRVVAAQKGKNRYLVDNDKATAAKGLLLQHNTFPSFAFLPYLDTVRVQICWSDCEAPSIGSLSKRWRS